MSFVADAVFKKNNRRWVKAFRGIFEEWPKMIESYRQVVPGDFPFWYTERANVGLLSGAAWRCELVALEEYQEEKTNRSGTKNLKKLGKWNGRCDLWLGGKDLSVFVEAKHLFVGLGEGFLSKKADGSLDGSFVDAVQVSLDDAVQDAKNTSFRKANSVGVGVTFVVPFINKNEKLSFDEFDGLKASVMLAMDGVNYDFFAWYLINEGPASDDCIYPGVLVLGKQVDG